MSVEASPGAHLMSNYTYDVPLSLTLPACGVYRLSDMMSPGNVRRLQSARAR